MGYLYTFLKPGHAYFAAWAEYRRRRRDALLALAGLLPVTALAMLLISPLCWVLNSGAPAFIAAVVGMLAGFVVNYVAQVRYAWWPCPRCHLPLFQALWIHWPFASRCLNCGLEKYAPCDPSEQKWEFESHHDISPDGTKR